MDKKTAELKKKIRLLFSDPKVQEFDVNYILKWLDEAKEDEVIKIAHITGGKRADPDARSSSEAISAHMDHVASMYVSETGKEVRFEHAFFGDGMNEPENVLFLDECKLTIRELQHFHANSYDRVLGYETSETDERIPAFDAVWDHHDKLPANKETFTDTRLELSATAMIVYFYVSPFLDRTNIKHRLLATALCYGIFADLESSGEHRDSDEEAEIEQKLDDIADHTILNKLRNQRVYETDFWSDEFWPNVKTKFFGSFAVQGVGFIKPSQERYIRILINDLIRTKGVSTAFCFGIVNNSCIVYKTRADDDSPATLREVDSLLTGGDSVHAKDKKSDSRKRSGGGIIQLLPKFREEQVDESDDEEVIERKSERINKFYRNVFDDIVEMLSAILPSSTSNK